MRDGQGNKLSEDEVGKITATETTPDTISVNKVSVDPGAAATPAAKTGDTPEPPETQRAPKF